VRNRYGRSGPPPRYPKNQEMYADPENWKYPVHTPYHAMAARRYFDKEINRAKYDPEEQAYIDLRINRALKRFGVVPGSSASTGADASAQGEVEERPPSNLPKASRDECLKFLLGEARLERAKAIRDDELKILQSNSKVLKARIRSYVVDIDYRKKIISHDCADWSRRRASRKLCKHLGKILIMIPKQRATIFLRDLIANPNSWNLT